MNTDGFTVQGRRRGGTNRESVRDRDCATFQREVPIYAGTSESFARAHARRYAGEEGLGPDGQHETVRFPHGSSRQQMHSQYTASTNARDVARGAYRRGLDAAEEELADMEDDERTYYENNTGGLAPHQHERLDPRAGEFRDKSYSNATNRENFLRAHPHGYHTKKDQNKHHGYADNAYGEYEYAREQQQRHEKHRSYSNLDPRRDRFGRPVSHR